MTVSVGVVALAGEDNPVASADAAMYRAKRAGGNRWMAKPSVRESRGSLSAQRRRRSGVIPSWTARVLSSRGAQATVGCAAALVLAVRYSHPAQALWPRRIGL